MKVLVVLPLVLSAGGCGGAVSVQSGVDASLDTRPDGAASDAAVSDAAVSNNRDASLSSCRPAGGLCFVRYCPYFWNPAPPSDEDCPGGSGEAGVCCQPGSGAYGYDCLAAGGECTTVGGRNDCAPYAIDAPAADQDCAEDPGNVMCCLPIDAGVEPD